jgi:6-phosphogluconolactonase
MVRLPPPRAFVYVGSFFGPADEGLRIYRWDTAGGTLEWVGAATSGVDNPLALATGGPQQRVLYVGDCALDSTQGNVVSAHAIDPATGALALLNRRPSGGTVPVHVTVSDRGWWLLVANCGPWASATTADRTVAVLVIQPDGRLGALRARHAHTGAGPDPVKQTAPHPHALVLDPAGRYAFAPDVGIDQVVGYRFDARRGTLTPHAPSTARTAPRSGPRQLRFHPTGRFAYLLTESASTVIAYAYAPAGGHLTALQTISPLPEGYTGERNAAELRIHPAGRFLYASNRGHDSIAAFAIDQAAGTLTPLGHAATHGRSPRAFAIDPTGRFLVVANEHSDSLLSYHLDPQTGGLDPTGYSTAMPHPACLTFVPVPA